MFTVDTIMQASNRFALKLILRHSPLELKLNLSITATNSQVISRRKMTKARKSRHFRQRWRDTTAPPKNTGNMKAHTLLLLQFLLNTDKHELPKKRKEAKENQEGVTHRRTARECTRARSASWKHTWHRPATWRGPPARFPEDRRKRQLAKAE